MLVLVLVLVSISISISIVACLSITLAQGVPSLSLAGSVPKVLGCVLVAKCSKACFPGGLGDYPLG